VKSRTIPHVDETPAWSVICFIVRPQFRRTGLSRAMLDAVVDYAKGRSDVSVLEVGRAQKTIFCARYLHPRTAAGDRGRAQRVMKSSNGANSVITYGQCKALSTNESSLS